MDFFGTLSKDWALECMKELLSANLRANLQIVVQVQSCICLSLLSLLEVGMQAGLRSMSYSIFIVKINIPYIPDVQLRDQYDTYFKALDSESLLHKLTNFGELVH